MQNHSNKHFPMNGKRKQVTHKPFVRGTEDQKGLHTDTVMYGCNECTRIITTYELRYFYHFENYRLQLSVYKNKSELFIFCT